MIGGISLTFGQTSIDLLTLNKKLFYNFINNQTYLLFSQYKHVNIRYLLRLARLSRELDTMFTFNNNFLYCLATLHIIIYIIFRSGSSDHHNNGISDEFVYSHCRRGRHQVMKNMATKILLSAIISNVNQPATQEQLYRKSIFDWLENLCKMLNFFSIFLTGDTDREQRKQR